jgi:glycine cleavage system aminomethyltransferase T
MDVLEEPLLPVWVVPSPRGIERSPKQFVDLQNDVAAADIVLAAREGYHSVEHTKRYTAMGFGTDQGKLGNINGMAILAQALGQDIPTTGTTTFRPNYTPVTFGAIAGPDLGDTFEPIRTTALHAWHEQHGALFENVGQWKRPWYFPQPGEDLHAAVARECLAARNGVAIMDASTLGKIDIRGPDAAAFLDWVYTNSWTKLGVGRCRYGLMLDENGMVMDDGVTTRLADHHFLMTTTTGGAARVMSWLERWLQTEWPHLKVYLTSVTEHWATAAVVGPDSRKVVEAVCAGIDFSPEEFPFMSVRQGFAAGVPARVMRISFSGELAYEINVCANEARHVWEALMNVGERFAITPYGTETMHVLRAEKGFIIVGQDTDGSITPIDLGMDWIVAKEQEGLPRPALARALRHGALRPEASRGPPDRRSERGAAGRRAGHRRRGRARADADARPRHVELLQREPAALDRPRTGAERPQAHGREGARVHAGRPRAHGRDRAADLPRSRRGAPECLRRSFAKARSRISASPSARPPSPAARASSCANCRSWATSTCAAIRRTRISRAPWEGLGDALPMEPNTLTELHGITMYWLGPTSG